MKIVEKSPIEMVCHPNWDSTSLVGYVPGQVNAIAFKSCLN